MSPCERGKSRLEYLEDLWPLKEEEGELLLLLCEHLLHWIAEGEFVGQQGLCMGELIGRQVGEWEGKRFCDSLEEKKKK
jgi:hypothetical protein